IVYICNSILLVVISSLLSIPIMIVLTFNVIIMLFSLFDLFFTPKRKELAVKRRMDQEIERGKNTMIELTIENKSNLKCHYRLIDALPQSFKTDFPIDNEIEAKQKQKIGYEVVPEVRGKYKIKSLDIRYRSGLGLWEKHATMVLENEVKVIPDL